MFLSSFSEIGEAFHHTVTHLSIGVFRKADTARISNPFQARCDVDAISHQVAVALLDYISEMDADPELDATFRWQTSVTLQHAVLYLDCAANGVNHAAEFKEDAVAGPFDDTAMM